MPELIPACFRGGAAAARPPEEAAAAAAAAGPSLTTSVYETRLGLVSLSWSRTAFGLSLLTELRLRDDDDDDDDDDDGDDDDEPLAFRIRPWLFWKRRGSKRFHLGDHRRGGPRSVELAWDLTRARFPPGGAPEPAGGYFVAVAVDGELTLVAGDLRGEAYRRTAARSSPRGGEALLISRREHVAMRRDARSGAVRSYSTSARFGGKEREITITLTSKEKEKEKEKEKKFKGKFKGEDMAMSISVDGSRVLHVRRLRWKFRGSDTVDIDSSPIQISWDLHSWLFPPRRDADSAAPPPPPPPPPTPPPPTPPPPLRAVFVFRFEREPTQADPKTTTKCESQISAPEKKRGSNLSGYGGGVVEEYLGKLSRRNWSESSSNNERTKRRKTKKTKKKNKKSLLKTSSSSSTASSTESTMSGSTVMDWASAEEAEMQRGGLATYVPAICHLDHFSKLGASFKCQKATTTCMHSIKLGLTY